MSALLGYACSVHNYVHMLAFMCSTGLLPPHCCVTPHMLETPIILKDITIHASDSKQLEDTKWFT